MKKCLRKKCQKDFEPNKPKQVFCSAKCRVYFSREEKTPIQTPAVNSEKKSKPAIKKVIVPPPTKGQPVKEKGEDSLAFALRKAEWKKNNQ